MRKWLRLASLRLRRSSKADVRSLWRRSLPPWAGCSSGRLLSAMSVTLRSSAYYLVGYAAECALKACIAKQFKRNEIPSKQLVWDIYTHKLPKLVKIAGLQAALEERQKQEARFKKSWDKVITPWDAESRYENQSRSMAEELVRAISDTEEGLLPWIRQYW